MLNLELYLAMIKYKEINGITNVMDGDTVIARYEVDRHWTEKNASIRDGVLNIRLYNRLKHYLDCKVELNNDSIQKIPQ